MSCNLRGADHMPYAAICHSIAVASCHGAPEPSGTCVCEVLPVCHDRPCMPNSEGGCFRSFHRHCLGLTKLPEGAFVCDACQTGVETCLGCRQLGDVSEMRRCTHPACGKTFHRQCARELPRAAGAPQSARPPARPPVCASTWLLLWVQQVLPQSRGSALVLSSQTATPRQLHLCAHDIDVPTRSYQLSRAHHC